MTALDRVLAARHQSLQHTGGQLGPGAMHLATMIDYDDELREAAAAVLLALLFEPGLSEHTRIFQQSNGRSIEAFIEGMCTNGIGR